jgi:UDP-3-O-[3-hydroxymyristoyl] glucosamine N-acyltransferase
MKLQRTVAEVAALVGGVVEGPSDRMLKELLPLELAGPEDMGAVFRAGAAGRAGESRAGCLLVPEGGGLAAGPARSLVRVADAAAALDRLVLAVAPRERRPEPGVHPSAVVEPGAQVAPDAAIMALAYVGAGARVGPRCVLRPGSRVGEHAVLGAGCELQANAVVGHRCVLGERVLLKPGAVVGADGFGFRQDADGRHHKIPQVGIVVLGDDVEIGSNTVVDRARFDATRIGRGCKLDGSIHVGHNVQMGEHCALAGNVSLAGSCTLEARVHVGGASGVVGGVVVREGTRVGAMTLVMRDTEPGSYVVGIPARTQTQWARETLAVQRLPEALLRLRRLAAGEGGDGS